MQHVYVTLAGENKVSIFEMDSDTGQLTFKEDTPLTGGPGPLTVDPTGSYMYVGVRSTKEMSSFRVNKKAGSLSHIRTIGLEADPCYISTDRTGNYLLAAYYSAGHVSVHPIGPHGDVSGPAIEWLATANKAHCVQMDTSNRFTFVPHVGESNVIHQFDFDEQTGKLTQNETPWVLGQKGFGPRHYAYHPTLDMIYFDNEQGCSVTAYALDRSTGTVEAMQTVSTLPDNYKDDNSCAQIHIAPSGNYVYASNRGHNSIAVFAIGPTTGMLTAVAQEPTVAIPRAFNIDPSGKFMLVGSLESGEIATYRIDSESGRLGHVETQKVGVEPMWIHITEPVG